MFDYHIHTEFSFDSNEKMEKIALQSITNGMKEICFTDHLEYSVNSDWEDSLLPLLEYKKAIIDIANKYIDKLTIKYGLELGYYYQTIKEMNQYVKDVDVDFMLLSMHRINNSGDVHIDMENYFKETLYIIEHAKNYSVLAHLDFFKRYVDGLSDEIIFKKHYDIIETILKKLIDNGKGLEINTAGIRHGTHTTNPSINIIKLYKELGGEIITTGSDAHKISDLSYKFEKTYNILKDLGFKYVCTFDKMVPTFNKI